MEKLLAVAQDQLEEIRCAYQAAKAQGHAPLLMVGFNRRLVPMTEKLREFFAKRQTFVDWARAVVNRLIQTVTAHALPDGSRYNRDNVAGTLSFLDGSIASLIYVANGDKSVPKEYFEVFCEGGVGIINDFCTLVTEPGRKNGHYKEPVG